jgi:tetratricopeptide (TPR) repeat protein
MRAEEPRAPMRHDLDHALPTVIHHPEDELPLLARWLSRAMENRARFWTLLTGSVVALIGLTVLANAVSMGRAVSDEAWAKLELARTAAERVDVADEFPKTPAQQWALLQAATEYFNQGFNDLPGNKDAALPVLKKALDLFERVAAEAPADSPQARAAALGVAQAMEARNDLDRAAKQYEKVAQTKAWAGTEEAKIAARRARELATPEARAFYKEFYAYKPLEATLAPGSTSTLEMPTGHPPIGGTVPAPSGTPGTSPEPSPLIVPPPPPSPTPKGEAAPKGLMLDLKKDTPEPKAKPKSKSGPGLPENVFTPGEGKAATPKK